MNIIRLKENKFQILYFIYATLTFSFWILSYTKIDISGIQRPLVLLMVLFGFIVVAMLAIDWGKDWSLKDSILILLGIIPLIPSIFIYGNYHILLYVILILGAKKVDIKKILTFVMFLLIAITVVTIVLAVAGTIPNTVTYRNTGDRPRYAMGFTHVSYFSSCIMSIIALWTFIRNKNIKIFEIVLMALLSIACYMISYSRMDFITMCFIVLMLIAYKINPVRRLINKIVEHVWMKRFLISIPGLICIFSIVLSYCYNFQSSVWNKLSSLSSRRLYSNAIAMHRYPVTLWGSQVLYHDNVTNGMEGVPPYYFIINNSYIQSLLILGVAGLVALIIMWSYIGYRELYKKNYIILGIIIAYSLLFFMEQRIYDLPINPFFLLLFYDDKDDFYIDKIKVFFRDRFKYTKFIRPAISCLLIAFIIEVTVFNINAITTSANESIQESTLHIESDDLNYNEDNDLYTFTTMDPSFVISNVYSLTGEDCLLMNLDFFTLGSNEEYKFLPDVKYDVEIYFYSVATENFEYLKTVTIDNSNKATQFIPLDMAGYGHAYKFVCHFDDIYQMAFVDVDFNGSCPFELNFIRIILVWLVCFAIYCYFSGKKNKKLKDVTNNDETNNDESETFQGNADKNENNAVDEYDKV